ncbi:MAG: metal ABC transporter permease [Gammaproteobacteria bacterium]|nr:MAG: metal ABC transporter permease [Gammaproteobacteria bacterium]
MNWDSVDFAILGPAILAGLLVTSTHVPLGRVVLQRGIIFIDLAIAQIAGLGIIAAATFGWDLNGWAVQIAAVSAALLGAALLNVTERFFPESQEAIIGVSFVLAATLGILLLANNPHGGEHLKELLVGQILWVDYEQLLPVAALYGVLLAFWHYWAHSQHNRLWFYFTFALTVTASVQLVGVYLVFATLIIPPLSTRKLEGQRRMLIAYTIAGLGYILGLILSALFNLPSGAVIVWTLFLVGLVTAFVLPNNK